MYNQLKNYGLKFDKSIKSWDEGIPLGNGKLGCLIYGDKPLKFALDRIDLWDNRESEAYKSSEFSYSKLVDCVKNGDKGWQEKNRFFDVNYNYPYPSKLSAGRIEINVDINEGEVCSSLDIITALTKLTYSGGNIETFISANENVGVIRITGSSSFSLHIPSYFSGDENGNWSAPSGLVDNDGTIEIIENGCLKYPRSQVIVDGEFVYYHQKTITDYNFCVMLKIEEKSDYKLIYYTVVTSNDCADCVQFAKDKLTYASIKGVDKLFNEHKKWWKEYWNKSQISIPNKSFEKTYYFSWYLFGATSRRDGFPMPLQGVWTADSDALPPWNGDYHHDTNTQMSYWGYAKANRLEEGRVFADYLWNLKDVFERYTKKVYGVDGCLLPGCSTLDGKFMGGCVQYSLSPTMTIWAAKAFDDYFEYSGDINYLKERAYPFFKRVADAIIALFDERDGKYYLPISSSPEIYEGSCKNFTIGNTNFDQSLILYLFKTLVKYCNTLNIDSKFYQNILSKLDGIYLSEDNVIKLSEKIKLPFSHRHFSHLMCVYPLQIFNYEGENKKIIDNSILEIEQLGSGWWVGFSFPWCATLYALQKNGNASYEKLRAFVKGFLSPNGFHLNGDYKRLGFSQWHYRPFTLEALYAYCDSIQEMLVQDYNGFIELFPAIPKEWNTGVYFESFRVRGGAILSAEVKNSQLIRLSIKTEKDLMVKIKNNYNILKKLFSFEEFAGVKDDLIVLNLKKGKEIVLRQDNENY
ncbi:MAG: glycoside hydrolase N-terminal domain-containing protein [Clostridia bacterium]|nr:glycoside hydrolase N-terminal domain-containing protein [Clostridia bacterium]